MTLVKPALLASAVALSAGLTQPALAGDSIKQALSNGEVDLSFRLRFEEVNQDGLDETNATTLKTRLSYKSGNYQGFGLMLEMDDVTALGDIDYRTAPNDSSNAGRAIIADAEGTEINQAYLSYTYGETTAKYGRQRILLDNQRFVGGVGFRQNEQTYDGFSLSNKSLEDTTLFFAAIDNVNRIFGEDNGIGDHEQETWLFNAKYSGFKAGSISAYAYLIDNTDVAAYSSDTYGLRFSGKTGNFGYSLEYAHQSDAADSPLSYDADYILAEGSYQLGKVKLTAGYELLGADGSDGQFMTPLATLHKFQGWTDQFLNDGVTPKGSGNIRGGIEDLYASAATKLAGVKLALIYHQYESDDSSASGMDDLGSEVGLVVAKKFGPVGLSLKYSSYSADNFKQDSDKLWLTASAKF